MRKVKLFTVDAFSRQSFCGNPAGVVFDDINISEYEMQMIAKELNLSETAFILDSDEADYRIRYFTPTIEIDFCGHATIALGWVLKEKFNINKDIINLETNVGIVNLNFEYKNKQLKKVSMRQVKAYIEDISIDNQYLASLLGINNDDIDQRYPVRVAYTGNKHLIVPIKTKNAIDQASPDFALLKEHNLKDKIATTHLFTFISDQDYLLYTRDFAPSSGIDEDLVTGSANGALAAYLWFEKILLVNEFKILQGNYRNRFGEIYIKINENEEGVFVEVKGEAKVMIEGFLNL